MLLVTASLKRVCEGLFGLRVHGERIFCNFCLPAFLTSAISVDGVFKGEKSVSCSRLRADRVSDVIYFVQNLTRLVSFPDLRIRATTYLVWGDQAVQHKPDLLQENVDLKG